MTGWGVALLLIAFPVALKLIKAWSVTAGRPAVLDLLRVIAADLVAGTSCALALLGLQHALRRAQRARLAVAVLSTLVLAVVLGLSAVEHQVWARTASLLDWGILAYTARHYAELSVVIASETTTASLLVLIAAGVLSMLPLVVDLGVGHRVRLPQRALSARAGSALLACAAVAFALQWSRPSKPELVPFARSAALTLLAGALSGVQERIADTAPSYAPTPDVTHRRIAQQLATAKLTHARQPEVPSNVLVFVLESTRFDATTLYEPNLPTTPQLARMAQHGALVERAYTEMPHTSKAVTSILCGYAPRWSVEISEAEVGGLPTACAPHLFEHLGFATAYFQSAWGTFERRRQFAENAGFGSFVARESLRDTKFAEVNYLAVEDRAMLAPILRFAEQSHRDDKPFFATVMTCGSHHGYGVPASFKKQSFSQRRSGDAPTPVPWDEYERYLNTVRYVDDFIGEVLRGLAERGLLEDTLVVVVGDHGQGFMEHGQKYHNEVIYEEGLRVPMLFYNEKLFPEPRTITGLRRQSDIVPSILGLLGVRHPSDMFEGQNVFATEGHARVYSSCWYDERCAAELQGNIKVIDHYAHKPPEVYDLAADPHERSNLLQRTGKAKLRWHAVARAAQQRMHAEKQRIEARYSAFERDDSSFLLASAPKPAHVVPARLESYIELLGYDADSAALVPGGAWDAVVYFRCLQPSPPGWRLFTRVVSVDNRIDQVDYDPASGRFDLTQCTAGRVVADRLRVWIPEDFSPGNTEIYWGSLRLPEKGVARNASVRTGERSVMALERGVVVRDNAVRLARREVAPRYRDDLAAELQAAVLTQDPGVREPLNVRFGNGLVLEEALIEPRDVRPYTPVKITTTWRVEKETVGPWKLYTYLDVNKRVDLRVHTPVDGLHPVTNWKAGTWVRDVYTLVLPRWLREGQVEVSLSLGYERKHMSVRDAGRGTIDARKRVNVGTITVRR